MNATLGPVLVTGARGMLGAEFMRILSTSGVEVRAASRPEVDLDVPKSLADFYRKTPGPLVIHCAAETNVDACEGDEAMAFRRNCDATLALAGAVRDHGAKMVFVSSSGVFDGRKSGPYDERDVPTPCTVYARSKVAAEAALLADVPGVLVIRAGWLFGGDASQKKNFVAARLREARDKSEVVSAADKTGSPTWTRDLVELVCKLVEGDASGVVHTVNSGPASRAEYVEEILRLGGLPATVRAVSSREFPRSAPVPDNESLASVRLHGLNLPSPRPWREALAAYFDQGLGGRAGVSHRIIGG